MKYAALFLVCSIILPSWNVAGCESVRHNEDTRAIVDEFTVLTTGPCPGVSLGQDGFERQAWFAGLYIKMGLVKQHGYPIDEHKVTTVDGYNIVFFRISGSPMSPCKKGKPVIFLQHGMLSSSDVWVLLGPGKDLAYLLADQGYEVWLGNVRGSTYGRSHTILSPTDKKFWSFSFHELATRDLPRMIDYILNYTGQKCLSYVGHSMGTTMSYILLSEIPEYNDKMRLVVSLAPVALWKQSPRGFIRLFAERGDVIKDKIFDRHGIYEFVPQIPNRVKLVRDFCSDHSLYQRSCALFYSKLASPKQLNTTLLPHILSYFPSGGSTMTLLHRQQNIRSGNFQQFDFGRTENLRLYGNINPPMYDVSKISAPIALYYGNNDVLSLKSNVFELSKRLQNVDTLEEVPFDTFNHLDFLWAKDAKELLYDRIFKLVKRYSG